MRSLALPILLCATLASGFARAAGPVMPMPPADQQRINALLGPGVVGQALPSDPIQDSSVYFPLQNREARYQVTSGPNAGKTESFERFPVKCPDNVVHDLMIHTKQ